MPTENAVEFENLSFAYPSGRQVLSNVDFAIPRGKLVAIMGQSGCGKTTLLRMIGGALRPSKGDVRVFGESLRHMRQQQVYALRRRMSMLFQFGALFTDMTSFENVAFQMREHTDTDVFHVTLHVRRGINDDGGSLYRSTRSTWERDHGRLVRL